MSTAKLRALFQAGRTYDEIAEANERSTGWRPTRGGVARKFERLGFPPRHASNTDLLPWLKTAGGPGIAREHNKSRLYYMLLAESKSRRGEELSDSDRVLVGLLNDLLFGRGRFLVIGYDRKVGFYLTDRTDDDDDIIRRPQERERVAEVVGG